MVRLVGMGHGKIALVGALCRSLIECCQGDVSSSSFLARINWGNERTKIEVQKIKIDLYL